MEVFGTSLKAFAKSSEVLGHVWISSEPYKESWHCQEKNVMPITLKKLAGILYPILFFEKMNSSPFKWKLRGDLSLLVTISLYVKLLHRLYRYKESTSINFVDFA